MSATPSLEVAALLRQHGIHPRRSLGQSFLYDPGALQGIVDAASILKTDVVLEIGCGLGSLTRYLAQAARSVVAVELDQRLAAIAQASLSEFHNVRIVCADFLEVTPRELGLPPGFVVAANIPYYVTSSILRKLLESKSGARRIVLTVQKEVAARICAEPPDMSLLAISVQVYGSARTVAHIPAKAFYPIPKVDSGVVRVDCYEQPIVSPPLLPAFFRLVKAGFSQPRKMLRNTMAAGLGLSAVESAAALVDAGIDPRRRAETVSLTEWTNLSEVLSKRAA